MGVPTFFRWVSEKYPKITQKCIEEDPSMYVDGTEMPVDATQPNPNGMEFDNLYLDMNGIIHPCTHPEDGSEPPTMELMFVAIGKHIERLFRLIRPRKLVYMAIDGIAPRAKMNQQRSRRFRSALEADEARSDKEKVMRSMKSRGLSLPKEADRVNFDSNVITPGTEFMDKLAEYLRFFIVERQATDPAWGKCKVILSDAQSPGEGEHKIMQFVRRQRVEIGHDPNCHHVMYGLDADLIMLGLASHEVRFTVLRDQVLFGKQNRKGGAKVDSVLGQSAGGNGDDEISVATGALSVSKLKPIEMLHVWILREYLQHEFRPESFLAPLPFPYDFERCIDDFVFLCFFVGNDFLPHLPSLSIREGGLELLINLYRKVLPTLPGFLTEDGDIHLGHVDSLLKVLGTVEDRIFQMRKAQEEREKQRKKNMNNAQNNNGRGGEHANDDNTASRVGSKRKMDITTLPPTTVDPKDLMPLGPSKKLKMQSGSTEKVTAPTTSQNKSAAAALRAQMKSEIKSIAKTDHEKESETSKEDDDDETIKSKIDEETREEEMKEEEFEAGNLTFEDRVKKLQDRRNVPKEEVTDEVRLGEAGWKDRYYESKFGKEHGSDTNLRRTIVESYVRGLCWVLQYYYKGCQSWKWYFDFHYAPFASDLTDLASISLSWAPSRPFKPFEQLMAVLPPQSSNALPEPCRWYMNDEDSEIADFYPKTINFDPNGKPVRWLWIALLPFIDETRLLEVTKRMEEKFNDDEKRRNAMMPDLLFVPKDAIGATNILTVLGKSPPNLLPNWESDQIAVLEDHAVSKLFQDALDLPAPTTAGDARGGGQDDLFLSAPQGGGISGYFIPAAPEFLVQIGNFVKSPFPKSLPSIPNSESFVCEFRLPPMLPHLSKLCEGVTIPAKVLNEQDLQIRRPKLSGLDVSMLLVENRVNSSGLERSWGSMEPSRIVKTQPQNPFMYPPPLLQAPVGPRWEANGYSEPHQYQRDDYSRGYDQYSQHSSQPYYTQPYPAHDQNHRQDYDRQQQHVRQDQQSAYQGRAQHNGQYPPQQQHVDYQRHQLPPSRESMLMQLQQSLHQHQAQWSSQQYDARGFPIHQHGRNQQQQQYGNQPQQYSNQPQHQYGSQPQQQYGNQPQQQYGNQSQQQYGNQPYGSRGSANDRNRSGR